MNNIAYISKEGPCWPNILLYNARCYTSCYICFIFCAFQKTASLMTITKWWSNWFQSYSVIKNSSFFIGIGNSLFITVPHFTPSRASVNQFTPSRLIFKMSFIVIPICDSLCSGVFPSNFLLKYCILFSMCVACHAHIIFLDIITLTIFGEG